MSFQTNIHITGREHKNSMRLQNVNSNGIRRKGVNLLY